MLSKQKCSTKRWERRYIALLPTGFVFPAHQKLSSMKRRTQRSTGCTRSNTSRQHVYIKRTWFSIFYIYNIRMFKYILYSQNSADWPEICCPECAARPLGNWRALLLILCIGPVAGYLPGHNVENFASCHILSLVHNGRNPGALLHIVLQFPLVEGPALGLLGLQGL